MPFRLLIAYQSLPIVRYDVHGVKRGKPKNMSFVCELEATTLHYAQTAAPYLPCIVVSQKDTSSDADSRLGAIASIDLLSLFYI